MRAGSAATGGGLRWGERAEGLDCGVQGATGMVARPFLSKRSMAYMRIDTVVVTYLVAVTYIVVADWSQLGAL